MSTVGPPGEPHSEPGGGDHDSDLDALIGAVQAEAARRRAEPGFPLDDEARLGVELDGQAPQPLAPKLERLARVATWATRAVPAHPEPQPGLAGRAVRRALSARIDPLAREVSSLGAVVARALRAVADQLAHLEARVKALEHPDLAAVPIAVTAATATSWWAGWEARLPEQLPAPCGRVLFVGADAEAAVHALRTAGIDAYGLNPLADRYQTHPDVRQGGVLEHLRAVGQGALGAVLLAGPEGVADRARLDELTRELARTTGTAVVLSEAPWWWRARLGPEDADLCWPRPLTAETWLAGLYQAGFHVAVEYDPSGSSYRVLARRPE